MKNKYDFEFCMKRDCKVCNRYLECDKKTERKRKFENRKNKNRKSKRGRIQSEN